VRYNSESCRTGFLRSNSFFTHQVSPTKTHSRSQRLRVCLSVCRCRRCTLLIMFADKEKAQYVLCFAATNSLARVQCKFRNEFRRKPPHVKNIHLSFEQVKEVGSVCKRKSSGRPAVTEENIERVRQSFIRRTSESISRRSLRNSKFNSAQSYL